VPVGVALRSAKITRSPGGQAYLNVGCGTHFSREWTNLDLHSGPAVVAHDVRRPLPFPDHSFRAAYSSHLLEHLEPEVAGDLLAEMFRVLQPGGVIRIAVPDLEGICRAYLARLEEAIARPGPQSLSRYRWSVLELLDQMVRRRPGGAILETLRSGDFDPEYVRERGGDECAEFLDRRRPGSARPAGRRRNGGPLRELRRAVRLGRSGSAADMGELHRWMYDRLSLRLALEQAGFTEIASVAHDSSSIPDWDRYGLDTSMDGESPRKPDSMFMEGVRP
jgi:predicted SAM-dependent methyltransferase